MNRRVTVAIGVAMVWGAVVAAGEAKVHAQTHAPTEAQAQDAAAMAQQKDNCKASLSSRCVISLALTGADDKMIAGNASILKTLMHAGRKDLVDVYLNKAGQKDVPSATDLEFYMRAEDAARRIVDLLSQANATGATPEQTKTRLKLFEDSLFEAPGFLSDKVKYARPNLYGQVADLLTDGVPGDGGFAAVSWEPVEHWIRARGLAKRYGGALDVFLARWQEVIVGARQWADFARSLIKIGRNEAAVQALRNRPRLTDAPFNSVYCSRSEQWLELQRPDEADAALQGTNCHDVRAKIAVQYAQKGERDAVQRLVDDVLKGFSEDQWREMDQIIYFVPISPFDTIEPLVNALMLSGDASGAHLLAERWKRHRNQFPRNLGGDARAMATLLIDMRKFDNAADLLENELRSEDFEWKEYNFPGLEFYLTGKLDRAAAILKELGRELPYNAAMRIYVRAVDKGDGSEVFASLEGKFGLKDAWLLHYVDLAHQVKTGHEEAAMKTLIGLLNEEKSRAGSPERQRRCLFSLRLAIAMNNRELAAEVLALLLDDFAALEGQKAQTSIANLIEAAAAYAQLEH